MVSPRMGTMVPGRGTGHGRRIVLRLRNHRLAGREREPKALVSSLCGMTRAAVALLAGIALLLAMRSKIFAGITYPADKVPLIGDPLPIVEMFFCFLAGFSESFVPNILSKTAEHLHDR